MADQGLRSLALQCDRVLSEEDIEGIMKLYPTSMKTNNK